MARGPVTTALSQGFSPANAMQASLSAVLLPVASNERSSSETVIILVATSSLTLPRSQRSLHSLHCISSLLKFETSLFLIPYVLFDILFSLHNGFFCFLDIV